MKEQSLQRCATCRYHEPMTRAPLDAPDLSAEVVATLGYCLRFPPRQTKRVVCGIQPVVSTHKDWCGEYAKGERGV